MIKTATQHYAHFPLVYTVDLDKALYKTQMPNLFVTKNKQAHKLIVNLTRSGTAIQYSGKVSATLINYATNATTYAVGEVANGNPQLVFPAEFYATAGMFCLLLSIGDSGTTNTVFAGEGYMINGETDQINTSPGVVPSLQELLDQLDAIIQATEAANTAAASANSATTKANSAATTATEAAQSATNASETAIAAAVRAEEAALGWESGTVGNAALLDGRDAGFYANAENLLDNPYFSQTPYNQRGETEYTGAVTGYDRWRGMSRAKVFWGEDPDAMPAVAGIEALFLVNTAPSAGESYIQQVIPPERFSVSRSNTYTVVLYTAFGAAVATGQRGNTFRASFGNTSATFLTSTNGNEVFRISVAQGNEKSVPILWVGLFNGTITADNIPYLRTRSQGEEAARCKWLFRRHGAAQTYGTLADGMARTATTAWITIPRTEMRDTPTVTLTGQLYVQHGNGSAIAVTAYNVEKISDDYIRLLLTVSGGLTSGMPVLALAGADSAVYIDEDCDLI